MRHLLASALILVVFPVTGAAGPRCADLAAAQRIDAPDVQAVFDRVEAPVRAMTGRTTRLAVLAAARFGPTARICPGAPPTVYVTHALVDRVAGGHYPKALLAFVFGHELGHRIDDLTVEGALIPRKGSREALADLRAAFFMTTAGFSARSLASRDVVDAFLRIEGRVSARARSKRRGALLKALAGFDGWEARYQTAIMLSFGLDESRGVRMLDALDKEARVGRVPLPELTVARALMRIKSAASAAPWLAPARLPLDASRLRCRPLFPAHTTLSDEPRKVGVRAPTPARVAAATRALKEARSLLKEAARRGGDPFVIAAASACAAFYLGDSGEARVAQAAARRHVPATASAGAVAALAHNAALIQFQVFLAANPIPSRDGADVARGWVASLQLEMTPTTMGAELTRIVGALGAYPKSIDDRRHGAAIKCRPGQESPRLPGIALEDGPVTLLRTPAGARDFMGWRCACAYVDKRGVTDRGETVWLAACPKQRLPPVLLLTGADGEVERLAVLQE